MLRSVTPFFIVDNLAATLEFYQSRLGFSVLYKEEATRPARTSGPLWGETR